MSIYFSVISDCTNDEVHFKGRCLPCFKIGYCILPEAALEERLGECRAKGIEKPCFLSYLRGFHTGLAKDHSPQSIVLCKFLTTKVVIKGKFFSLCNLILSCELDFN